MAGINGQAESLARAEPQIQEWHTVRVGFKRFGQRHQSSQQAEPEPRGGGMSAAACRGRQAKPSSRRTRTSRGVKQAAADPGRPDLKVHV
jgi:hypothetical protein